MFSSKETVCIAALSTKLVFVDECIQAGYIPTDRIEPIDLFNLFTGDIIRKQTIFYR